MFAKFADWTTRLIAWLRRKRVYRSSAALVKINLGSGLSVAPGWINIDGSLSALVAPLPAPILKLAYRLTSIRVTWRESEYIDILSRHKFIFHNLVYGIPAADQTVDVIFSSHMLEHLTQAQGQRLIRDAYRVLKPGGLIRIAVPDLARAFDLYQQGQKQAALGFFYLPEGASDLGRHQYLYDFETLAALLRECGFIDIEHCAFQSGRMPDLNLLDSRPEQTLFVEASKG
jgi:predicted SAM-dependent methyltransferase